MATAVARSAVNIVVDAASLGDTSVELSSIDLAKSLLEQGRFMTSSECELKLDRSGRGSRVLERYRPDVISLKPGPKLSHGFGQRKPRGRLEEDVVVLERHVITLRS